MDETKWMTFIHQFWGALSYWELMKMYRKYELHGAFFSLSALASRNELLMRIAHVVHLCKEVAKAYDIGNEATTTLAEIKKLYEKGDTPDRSVLQFEDCGVKPFRDKVLAHPLNPTKALLGKSECQILLKWDTVEQTLAKIREFADQVEEHNLRAGQWDFSTYKDAVDGVDVAFSAVMIALEDAAKYDRLQLAIKLKGGKATVSCDWRSGNDDIVVED